MRFVATKIVEKYWDLETDWVLQVTLAVGCADKPACDVVMATDFGTLRFTFNKLVTADVALSCIIIFIFLAGTKALHRSIRPENRHDFCFSHNERVRKLGESVFPDFHHGLLVKVIKTRGLDGRCCAHFVLLGISGVLHLATKRLKDGLKVGINDERCLSTILIRVKLELRLHGTWRKENMENRQKVVSGANLFVPSENYLRYKMAEASETKLLLWFVFCNICKQTGYACDWCIMLL